MSLPKLVDAFSEQAQLPIEVSEIRNAIVANGYQDEILFSGQDADPGKCRGVFYQFTRRSAVYGDTELVTLIVYSLQLSKEWQRVVCCKEMVHIMDRRIEQTRTADEVQGLLDKLLGPLSTEDYGLADLMAAHDRIALYQCLPLLFPDAARSEALSKIASRDKTIADIVDWACLPTQLVELVMSEAWPALKEELINC